jgi:hypothetical protein
MLHQQLKPIAVAAILTLGILAGANLSAQEQAPPQNKPGSDGMMGHEGMPGGMMGQDGRMAQMRQMMEGCSKMMQAQATPPAQPPANGNQPQPEPRG